VAGQRFGSTSRVIDDPAKLVLIFEPCRVTEANLAMAFGFAEE